ncbi:hypothetical protein EVAR_100790_1 [Eumeta japonica]|uniref:Uncharacterized protein n=1 Tax=Eumeta variegata TaxID=151549 RepID=A0A4C2ACK3_EUMVA|nr:hypothetical protein EVAR_100790_1 [Eumeta japonica]
MPNTWACILIVGTWRKHIWTKRKQLDTPWINVLIDGRKSNLSHESKIAIYKTIPNQSGPGDPVVGHLQSQHRDSRRFQSKTPRTMLDIPYYVSNKTFNRI